MLAHAPSDELFATVCSVVIEHDLTAATITLAGHPTPILFTSQGAIEFDAKIGIPLGVSEAMAWTPFRIELPSQFSLLLYTDGLIEGRATPDSSERFGKERLLDAIKNSPNTGHALLQEVVLRAKDAHGGALPDDAALLLIERQYQGRAVTG